MWRWDIDQVLTKEQLECSGYELIERLFYIVVGIIKYIKNVNTITVTRINIGEIIIFIVDVQCSVLAFVFSIHVPCTLQKQIYINII